MLSGGLYFCNKYNKKIGIFTKVISERKILTGSSAIPKDIFRNRGRVAEVKRRILDPDRGWDFSILVPNGTTEFDIGLKRVANRSEEVELYDQEFSKLLAKKVQIILESDSVTATVLCVDENDSFTIINEIPYYKTMILQCKNHTPYQWHIGAPIVGHFPRYRNEEEETLKIYGLIISCNKVAGGTALYTALQLDGDAWDEINNPSIEI